MGNSASVLQFYQRSASPPLPLVSIRERYGINCLSNPCCPLTLTSWERQGVYGYLISPQRPPPASAVPKHAPHLTYRKIQDIPEDRWMVPCTSNPKGSRGYVFFVFCFCQISPKQHGVKLFKHCRLYWRNLSGTQKHKSVSLCQNWWSWRAGWRAATSEMALWISDGVQWNSHRSEPKNTAPARQSQKPIPGWKRTAHVWLKFKQENMLPRKYFSELTKASCKHSLCRKAGKVNSDMGRDWQKSMCAGTDML